MWVIKLKKCFQESGRKRTFHKTGDQLKVQGPDLFQINKIIEVQV